jgi:ABC-2 type transport system permease protein
VLLSELGPVLKLNQAVIDLTPFAHAPKLPGGSLSWMQIVWPTLVSGVLVIIGAAAFRRRDVG